MSTAEKVTRAATTLAAAEQAHRALMDAHTQHVWGKAWDAQRERTCETTRREAWAKVQRAQKAYEEASRGSGWSS
jgi:hypothetical protein